MRSPLILIGPMHAGKTTIAGLLAERWGVRRISMDGVCWDYYGEIGYDEARQEEAHERAGLPGAIPYLKPFEAHAVERLLEDVGAEPCVIDFGAGHSVFEDPELFARVQKALRPHAVVLLLPSPDPEESISILRARGGAPDPQQAGGSTDHYEHSVRHPSNGRLAKFTIYNAGRTPEQTVEEISNLVSNFDQVA